MIFAYQVQLKIPGHQRFPDELPSYTPDDLSALSALCNVPTQHQAISILQAMQSEFKVLQTHL
jgi:hypothetical protein